MRRIGILVAVAALAVPAVAAADGQSSSTAEQQCRAERAQMGIAAFKALYGTNHNRSNAFGKCVSHRAKANAGAQQQAAQTAPAKCRAEQADPNFAAAHGGKTFAQFYGTNRNGKNAFGKCTSQKAQAQTKATERSDVQAEVNAAKQCQAERRQLGSTAFAHRYGTNHNRNNAFGRCASRKVRGSHS
jgi:hypothetical protein